jgi:hypothetical protein
MGGGTVFDPVSGTAIGKNRIVSLSLPDAAASIPAGNYIDPTFQHFTVLKTVMGANVTDIGSNAFSDCTSLAAVNLPAATNIGNYAFDGCTVLAAVNLPAATNIGNYAFSGTGNTALTVTLGAAAPMLGTDMFDSVTSKYVTVRVPGSATGYTYTNDADTVTPNWGNGFRYGGWNGAAMTGGTVNSGISLTVMYVP